LQGRQVGEDTNRECLQYFFGRIFTGVKTIFTGVKTIFTGVKQFLQA
jgi:hypothetical protein